MLDPALIVTVEPDALTLTALALNKELSLIKKFPKLKDVGLDIAVLSSKTAKKMKKREWIEDYFLQGCAYSLAHNEMFGTNISKVAILMVDRDGNFKDFTISGDEYEEYCDKWSDRLATYYSK